MTILGSSGMFLLFPALVVHDGVAVLANVFGVDHLVRVFTLGGISLAPVDVVTVITHTLGIVLQVRVLTSRDKFSVPLLGRRSGLRDQIQKCFARLTLIESIL